MATRNLSGYGLPIGVLAFSAAGTLVAIAAGGWTEETVRLLVRLSARLSVLLFLVAFVAEALHEFNGSRGVRRIAERAAAFFLAFAASHIYHLALLGVLAVWFPDPFVKETEALTVVGGGLAYAFLVGIAVAIVRTGHFPNGLLATIGVYYIWVVFTRAYSYRLDDTVYVVIFALLIVAFIVRVGAHLRSRRQPAEEIA